MQQALRQAAFALVTLSVVALVLSTGIVGSTSALFNGETQNAASSFAGGWIDPPASVTAAASGYDVVFGWTPGTHGPVTGQTLYWANNTTNSNCTGAGYTAIAPSFTAALAAYTDSNRGASANGNWFCYRLVSTSATAWTAQVDKALQVGLAATAVTLTNGGTAGSIDAGDKIAITFNQQTNLAASGTTKVCVIAPSTIILGDTTAGNGCNASDGYNVGQLTGEILGRGQVYKFSTFTTSSTAPWTMTITLVGSGNATYSGTTTFVPSPSILSAATTHQAALCTAAATTCRPTTTSIP